MTVIKLRSFLTWFTVVATTVICVLSVALSGAYAVFWGGTTRLIPIYSVERDDKTVAISFDCAWGTEYTDAILEALEKTDTKATFFMVEFWTKKYADYVKKIDAAGCEIGTHSATHSYMSKQNESEIRSELLSSSKAIEDITGKKVELFRAPYGDYNNKVISTASAMGLYTIQWDVDSLDWKDLSGSDIAMRVINGVKSGSIILMHNNGLHTAEAVPVIISTLKNRGYTFVPIGQLIYRENYTVDASGRQVQAS